MAGRVDCNTSYWGHAVQSITPTICPATDSANGAKHCAVVDVHGHHANLCPFASRLEIGVGGSRYDVWTMDALMQWIASQDVHVGRWSCICLRKESAGTDVGARLRP